MLPPLKWEQWMVQMDAWQAEVEVEQERFQLLALPPLSFLWYALLWQLLARFSGAVRSE
jgi:hypothetical protein